MLTLRDKIFIETTVPDEYVGKYINYELTMWINTGLSISLKEIFSGRCFCQTKNIKIYISDLINDNAYKGQMVSDISYIPVGNEPIMFTVNLSGDGGISAQTKSIICTNPMLSKNITEWEYLSNLSEYKAISINRYLTDNDNDIVLPTLPVITSDNTEFFFSNIILTSYKWISGAGLQTGKIRLVSLDNKGGYNTYFNFDVPQSGIIYLKITDIATLKSLLGTNAYSIGVASTDSTVSQSLSTIAKVDRCNSEYFLIWVNRAGNYQCQPFNKKVYFAEDITTKNIINFIDESRPYLKEVASKWTLHSGWLTNSERDEYESILVSPCIYLYNNYTGRLIRVNCEQTSWEQKTKNNNNKPHNMIIELSSDRKQRLLY